MKIKKEDKVKAHIVHLIQKTIGMPNIIRIVEWRSLFEYLDPKEGERILDVACGRGELSLKIVEKGRVVHAIDISEDAINSAKRLAEREEIAHYSGEYFESILKMTSRIIS